VLTPGLQVSFGCCHAPITLLNVTCEWWIA